MNVLDFLTAFPDAKQVGDHYMVRCPSHEDDTASLAIKERDGKILVHCFGGCQPEQVLGAAGYSWSDVFSSNGYNPRFNIRDYSGALRAIHTRRDRANGKTFAWLNAEGGSGLAETPVESLPLYGAEAVGAWDMDQPVVVAEGEKAALALMAAGLQAVGTVCGASSTPSDESLSILTANDVVLWPDADDVGYQHMRRIAARLRDVAASVRIVRWPNAPAKADAADVGDAATIRRLVELAEPLPSALKQLTAFSTDPPPPMLIERLDPSGHTLLYGPGGAGKGTYAAWLLVRLVHAGHKPLVIDYEHHPEEWARRVYGLDPDALPRILYAAPLSAAWEGKRGPLWETADELRALCIEHEVTIGVIDSVAIACAGSDVSDPGTPSLYAAGLELLERPITSIAHVNRAGDMTYPFGSVFWHNLARLSWSLEADGPRGILTPRKANNYERMAKVAVEVTWHNGRPVEVAERSYGDTVADRIRLVMGSERMTVRELTDAINDELDDGSKKVSEDDVRKTLNRMAGGLAAEVGNDAAKRNKRWFKVLEGGLA